MQSHVVAPPAPTTDPLTAFHLGQLKELAERLNRRYLEEADRDARSASEALRAYAALLETKAPQEATGGNCNRCGGVLTSFERGAKLCANCEDERRPHEPKPSEATGTRDMEPLVAALIQAVKMERDLFNETSDDYSTEALMLAKERVALCKAALLGISHEPEGVLALVKQKRDEYRSFLDAGKGTWPGSDYIQDETWARWQGAWSVLDSIVSQAERERPCLFDKLVGNPLDGFPSTKDGEPT